MYRFIDLANHENSGLGKSTKMTSSASLLLKNPTKESSQCLEKSAESVPTSQSLKSTKESHRGLEKSKESTSTSKSLKSANNSSHYLEKLKESTSTYKSLKSAKESSYCLEKSKAVISTSKSLEKAIKESSQCLGKSTDAISSSKRLEKATKESSRGLGKSAEAISTSKSLKKSTESIPSYQVIENSTESICSSRSLCPITLAKSSSDQPAPKHQLFIKKAASVCGDVVSKDSKSRKMRDVKISGGGKKGDKKDKVSTEEVKSVELSVSEKKKGDKEVDAELSVDAPIKKTATKKNPSKKNVLKGVLSKNLKPTISLTKPNEKKITDKDDVTEVQQSTDAKIVF